jgi:hypothetical protein
LKCCASKAKTMEQSYRWYILFPNHHQGLRLNRALKQQGIKSQIAPTPREASVSCGISLIVDEGDLERIYKLIDEIGVAIDKVVKLPVKTDWKYRGI